MEFLIEETGQMLNVYHVGHISFGISRFSAAKNNAWPGYGFDDGVGFAMGWDNDLKFCYRESAHDMVDLGTKLKNGDLVAIYLEKDDISFYFNKKLIVKKNLTNILADYDIFSLEEMSPCIAFANNGSWTIGLNDFSGSLPY